MDIVEQISSDLTAAMKAGDSGRTAVLRLLKNSLKNEQIKLGHELSGDEAVKVVRREGKQRRDSIEAYTTGGRLELAAAEKAELDVIEKYLPRSMASDELAKLVDQVIAEIEAKDMSQMGQVMSKVLSLAGGQVDGAEVSVIVRQRLG